MFYRFINIFSKESIKEKKNIPNKNEEAYSYRTLIACLLSLQNFMTI